MDPDEHRETQGGIGGAWKDQAFSIWEGEEDSQLIISPSLSESIRFKA